MRHHTDVAVGPVPERRRAAGIQRSRGGRLSGLRPALVCTGLAFMTFFTGCTHATGDEGASKLDSGMRSMAVSRPDSVVGVLVRIRPPLDEARRDSLRTAGLLLETQAGGVLTGTLRAGSALAVARLSFVERLELARQLPVHRSTS